jgi:S-DNA-T family DNA segregation ATPase FtsK/SpoIIIE
MPDRKTARSSPTLDERIARLSEIASDVALRVLARADDLLILLLGAGALLTALGLAGVTRGAWIDPWSDLVRRWLGWGAAAVPLTMAAAAVLLGFRRAGRPVTIAWGKVIAFEIAFAALLALLAVVDGVSLPRAESGSAGGIVGWGLASLLDRYLGIWGTPIVLGVVLLVCLTWLLYGLRWPGLAEIAPPAPLERRARPGRRTSAPSPAVSAGPETPAPTGKRPARVPSEFRKSFKVNPAPREKPARLTGRDRRLPSMDILDRGENASITSAEINRAAGIIEKTLAEFGLPVRVVDFRTGPAVTQFAVEPGFLDHTTPEGERKRQKVRVSQISALASDLALALSAPTLRIEAPVPGQPYVGIEVPNRRSAVVRLRPVIESDAFQSVGSPLAIALGRDVAGKPVVADLASMPHLLVAGTTGSGKSVCLTSLTACLALNNAPEDLRLVLIDPKMVELVRFNGLPHLFGKVETDLKRIVGVLRWCTAEMDRRYRLLEEARARDLAAYNRRASRRSDMERLPRIVVLLDELADLMMMAPDQTERTLVRLAQMARATGLHLVVATQRPSTDIVTGLIKANFPARISFAVASAVDSRVILDATGAETLLGRGDMLFLSPEAGSPVRVQGAYLSDLEIERLVDYWQEEAAGDEAPITVFPPWEDMIGREERLDEEDEVLEKAIELVKRTGRASASMLQRRLRLGYPRAARLMDELESLGVIGRPQSGGRTREVLTPRDEGVEGAGAGDEEGDEVEE